VLNVQAQEVEDLGVRCTFLVTVSTMSPDELADYTLAWICKHTNMKHSYIHV